MFRNVFLEPEDRDATRFLRPMDNGKEVKIMRHLSLPFGFTSSPFQALKILRKHMEQIAEAQPELKDTIKTIQEASYVDDTAASYAEQREAENLLKAMETIFVSCGMQCHKFCSNDKKLLTKHVNPSQLLDSDETTILGIQWDITNDKLRVVEPDKVKTNVKETKRTVLSTLAQLFDILGQVSPYSIRAKIILQQLWEAQVGWDDELPADICQQYEEWKTEMPLLKKVQVPRWVGFQPQNGDRLSIAVFGDASFAAYAAVAYAVVTHGNGQSKSHLLLSKARVSPKKLLKTKKMQEETISICRLELCAAVLACKLAKIVQSAFNLPTKAITIYTDSTVTLGRIRQGSANYSLYVGNRVQKCRDNYPAETFKYVHTKSNPADLCSRGSTIENLMDNPLWFNGPDFLRLPEKQWTMSAPTWTTKEVDADKKEKRKKPVADLVLVTLVAPTKELDSLRQRTNDWGYMKRVISYMYRFIDNTRIRSGSRKAQPVSIESIPAVTFKEMTRAEMLLLKVMQSEAFESEIKTCLLNEPVKGVLSQVMPFLDDDGILKQKSRIIDNPDVAKKPIILAKRHPLTEALILYNHRLLCHTPPETTYIMIRRRFWLQGGRRELKRILHLCKKDRCRKHQAFKVIMGPLPSFRTDYSQPMMHVSLDLAGPFLIRHGCDLKNCPHPKYSKAYLAVFCCNSTRYIHVEPMEDMTTNAMLMALERFFGRRGTPLSILSDNGRQIVAANKELQNVWQKIDKKRIDERINQKGVKWHFSNVFYPSENGLAEASVKIVKSTFMKIFKHGHLTFTEFGTAVSLCEGIVNSRPLGTLKEDSETIIPVTPADLVYGKKLQTIPEDKRKLGTKTKNYSRMMQHRSRLIESFWRHFSHQYLERLSFYRLWRENKVDELKVGTVVQLTDKNTPRGRFLLGVVTELHHGRDGNVRAATLRLGPDRYTRRNIRQLSLFEEGPTEDNSETETENKNN